MKNLWFARFVSAGVFASIMPDAGAQTRTPPGPPRVSLAVPACTASEGDYPACISNNRVAQALARVYFENYVHNKPGRPTTIKILLPSHVTINQAGPYLQKLELSALALATETIKGETWMHGEMGQITPRSIRTGKPDDLGWIERWTTRMSQRIAKGAPNWQIENGEATYQLFEGLSPELQQVTLCRQRDMEMQLSMLSTCGAPFPAR